MITDERQRELREWAGEAKLESESGLPGCRTFLPKRGHPNPRTDQDGFQRFWRELHAKEPKTEEERRFVSYIYETGWADKAEAMECGQRLLAQSLTALTQQRIAEWRGRLTDDEARLFALLMTPVGTTKEGATKYPSQREIGALLGVSHSSVRRREAKLRDDHDDIANWLDNNIPARKPRGKLTKSVPNRKTC